MATEVSGASDPMRRGLEEVAAALTNLIRNAYLELGSRHGPSVDLYGGRELRIADERVEEALLWAMAGLAKGQR